MARTINMLSTTGLRSLSAGLHHDGNGLYLQVKNGGRSWLLRFMIDAKRRHMGLGALESLPLADARREARACRQRIQKGIDPIAEREQRRQAARVEAAKSVTFQACAERYIKSNRAGWRNEKHGDQYEATLATYAYPVFGSLPVQAVDTDLVVKALEPIWTVKTETATRVRQRIEAVLDWAKAREFRFGENPARWRGHLDKLLPPPRKVVRVKHFEAMPHAVLPEFYADLRERKNVSAKALTFTILTAARSGETRLATVAEIDFANAVWTIPAGRTKGGREHRVPLPKEALAVLRGLNDCEAKSTLLFPNALGRPLSDAAMRKYLQEDMGHANLTVHGFRSTFRDWTADRTNIPREIAEAALGHAIGDKTEAAYRRTDALDRRRRLMDMWAKFCVSGSASTGKVVTIGRAV